MISLYFLHDPTWNLFYPGTSRKKILTQYRAPHFEQCIPKVIRGWSFGCRCPKTTIYMHQMFVIFTFSIKNMYTLSTIYRYCFWVMVVAHAWQRLMTPFHGQLSLGRWYMWIWRCHVLSIHETSKKIKIKQKNKK
jgi:hypothetical protein